MMKFKMQSIMKVLCLMLGMSTVASAEYDFELPRIEVDQFANCIVHTRPDWGYPSKFDSECQVDISDFESLGVHVDFRIYRGYFYLPNQTQELFFQHRQGSSRLTFKLMVDIHQHLVLVVWAHSDTRLFFEEVPFLVTDLFNNNVSRVRASLLEVTPTNGPDPGTVDTDPCYPNNCSSGKPKYPMHLRHDKTGNSSRESTGGG